MCRNGKFQPLVLRVKSDEKYQSTLFELLLRNWEKLGDYTISKSILMTDYSKLLNRDITYDIFKSIFRHLRDKIVAARLDTLICTGFEENEQGGSTGILGTGREKEVVRALIMHKF